MGTPTTGILRVPGGGLYYEVRGSGPVLLVIPTGNGDATPFGPMADTLADRHTVITYDRRGFSRSTTDQPVDDTERVDVDVEDAHRLLLHLAAEPADVLGTCSGAIVALALLGRHPDRIRTLVAHEPPLTSVLPDSAEWTQFHADLYDIYRTSGMGPARDLFKTSNGLDGETRPPEDAVLPPDQLAELLGRLRVNMEFWFEHEMRTYPDYSLDQAALKATSDQLVLAGGDTSREHLPYRPNTVLADVLGTEIVHFPGGHLGYVTHPYEFAATLTGLLHARS